MTSNNSHIVNIYNSRKNLLEILHYRGFNIENYKNFSINEISTLFENNQLDMLIENEDINKKIYVKYYVAKVIKTQNLYDIIEDLFNLENILTKNDDLIIVIKDEPNETLEQVVKDIWNSDNYYISLLNIKRLQFNILNHKLVPNHKVLNKEDVSLFKKKYNITHDNELPDISYFSPVSLVLGIRPGDIVEIERNSRTSITSKFYRICKIY